MFFAGIATWHLGALFHPQKPKHVAWGGTAILLLLSMFFLFGGTTMERFLKIPTSSDSEKDDYRVLIQEDALKVSLRTPFLGVGLGNFEPVFASQRQLSADQNRAIHPESDWLWMAIEMGWGAPLLILASAKWWLWECLPFAVKQGEALRRGAMAASVMFILHGFVDVSGHRVGSLLVGLLMASLALSPKKRGVAWGGTPVLFRGLGLIVGLIGTWWATSIYVDWGPPTTATIDRLQTQLDLNAQEGRLASVSEAANAALDIEPLNWTYYFRRGSAAAFRNGGIQDATADFQISHFLEPNSINLCVNEGQVWLAADETRLCLDAWREALQRAGSKGIDIYPKLLQLSQDNPGIHHGLQDMAASDVDYLIAFLDYATPDEEKSELDGLLARDPNLELLSSDQQRKLFSTWAARGDQSELADLLLSHTQLQITGWRFLAQHFADKQDFELASVTALRYLPQPVIQQVSIDPKIGAQDSHFADDPDDVIEGSSSARPRSRKIISTTRLSPSPNWKSSRIARTIFFILRRRFVLRRNCGNKHGMPCSNSESNPTLPREVGRAPVCISGPSRK